MFNPHGRVVQTPTTNRVETECESSPYYSRSPECAHWKDHVGKHFASKSGCTRNRKVGTNPNRGHSYTPIVGSEQNRTETETECHTRGFQKSHYIILECKKFSKHNRIRLQKYNLCTKFHICSLLHNSEIKCQNSSCLHQLCQKSTLFLYKFL
ncbi:hypothetical protein I3842_16G070400 [Carya illinoinensis]|uniref:Uncharacterized protein n=1 Tax=Carya illinoinensis TaxID=32201 RepID=A0A922D4U6_CARIL|nr:hypothetical protein I3842_16G070400 [Carya illinoinensis]